MDDDIDLSISTELLYHHADIVGLGDGVQAVIAIGPDGAGWPYLINDHDHRAGTACCPTVVPAHECLGRLPAETRRRINRCQGITASGRRDCSRVVPIGETACYQHRPKDGGR